MRILGITGFLSLVRRFGAATLWLLVLVAAAPAFGEDNAAKANRLFTEARDKLKDNDREAAIELLDEAERFFAHPAILLLKARTQREVGMLDEADATLGRVDDSKLPKPLKKVHSDERDEIAAARRRLGRLKINVQPPEALVVVDKREFRGGYDRWREPGETRAELIAPGHQPAVRSAQIVAGETVTIDVQLAKLRGTIRVEVGGGLRGVDVLLDGNAVPVDDATRTGDVVNIETGLGKHEILCRRGEAETGKLVEVQFGQVVRVRCDGLAPRTDVARLSLGWGGVAAGAAMLGYGVWGVQSYFADVDYAEKNGLIAQSNKHYGGALFMASGVAMGLASWWLLVRQPDDDSESKAAALAPRAAVTAAMAY